MNSAATNELITKEQIAEKRGLIYYKCSSCSVDVYYKYHKEKPLCDTCKNKKKKKEYANKRRTNRVRKLLNDEIDKVKIQLIINKFKAIEEDAGITSNELHRIFSIYIKEEEWSIRKQELGKRCKL